MILAERLTAGDSVAMAWSSIAATAVVELLAHNRFDAVTLDMQHGGHDEASVFSGLAALVGNGKGAIVRIPVGRYDMASRALDFGAEAVIAPMINSRADARAFASAMKYPPIGERSWGPSRAMNLHGYGDPKAYLTEANSRTLAFAMIETRAALDALDDILGVDGIDGVFVGPTDFSISWTAGGTVDAYLPDMMEAVASIAARARSHGKYAGIFVFDPARARPLAEMGYRLLALTNDVFYLNSGAQAALRAASGES